ncbi:MAG TPA: hypothetical protein VKQ27_00525 [Acetobacteraceae bacterium]|nr:hypothetical protein [Acetobacteraceae bacterium]
MSVSDGDKLAAVILAAARCAATDQHEVKDYMQQYEKFLHNFEEARKKVSKMRQVKITGF